MKLLQASVVASEMDELHYGENPSYLEHLQRQACEALAETIIKDASLYRKEATKQAGWAAFRHVWTVGVQTDLSELEQREQQIAEATRAGMAAAAAIVRVKASGYDRVDGHCKHVIVDALLSAARAIDAKAAEARVTARVDSKAAPGGLNQTDPHGATVAGL